MPRRRLQLDGPHLDRPEVQHAAAGAPGAPDVQGDELLDGQEWHGRGVRQPRVGHTRELLRHLAITERACVRSQTSAERLQLVTAGCGVSEARARRLIRSVITLWHFRARAFGTVGKAKARLLPMAQALFEKALADNNLGAANAALKTLCEICGVRGGEVVGLPLGDVQSASRVPQEASDVADRVLSRLLAHGAAQRPQA